MLKLKITSEVEKIVQVQESLRDLTEVYGAWSDDGRDLARANVRSYSRGGGLWESIARSVRSGYNADGGQMWSDHYAARHKDQGGPIQALKQALADHSDPCDFRRAAGRVGTA